MKNPILLRESFSRYFHCVLPGYSTVECPGPVVLIPDTQGIIPLRSTVITWIKDADQRGYHRIDIGNSLQGAAL